MPRLPFSDCLRPIPRPSSSPTRWSGTSCRSFSPALSILSHAGGLLRPCSAALRYRQRDDELGDKGGDEQRAARARQQSAACSGRGEKDQRDDLAVALITEALERESCDIKREHDEFDRAIAALARERDHRRECCAAEP